MHVRDSGLGRLARLSFRLKHRRSRRGAERGVAAGIQVTCSIRETANAARIFQHDMAIELLCDLQRCIHAVLLRGGGAGVQQARGFGGVECQDSAGIALTKCIRQC